MRRAFLGSVLGVAVVCAGACGHYEFEPPDREGKVREAAAAYTPAMFDSITWDAAETRSRRGNQLYVEHCRTCHGPLGQGGTDYAVQQGFEVASLVEPSWPLADPDSLHRVIFVGHADGMPVFGDHDLTPREIDAVTGYILDVLRPDVLGPRAGG
ncbi:MAG: cytochrome c [Gemmatimonadetes bacterium]|nr:cytochrome c [Gemmatimonadota bacterium]